MLSLFYFIFKRAISIDHFFNSFSSALSWSFSCWSFFISCLHEKYCIVEIKCSTPIAPKAIPRLKSVFSTSLVCCSCITLFKFSSWIRLKMVRKIEKKPPLSFLLVTLWRFHWHFRDIQQWSHWKHSLLFLGQMARYLGYHMIHISIS